MQGEGSVPKEEVMRGLTKTCAILAAVIAVAIITLAQDQPKTKIKHVPIKPTSAASGQEMYKSYCASCHGIDAKGNGPAAEALKVPPTDLTMLAAKNGGKYPALKVAASLRGEETLPAHGTKEMPIWGNLFWSISGGHQAEVQQRIANLNTYLESLQKK
jgi:mono/diheme cytochrome c family protein